MTAMAVLTPRQVHKVAGDVKNARHMLAETVRGRAKDEGGVFYWGQFLDGGTVTTQLGVYGSAAGAELLARNGERANVQMLCEAMGDPAVVVPGFKDHDAALVHKAAATASAAATIDPSIGITNPAVTRLLALELPGGGWCGYDAAASPTASRGRVETAASLLALAKVPAWRSNPKKWTPAVDWLAEHLSSGDAIAESLGLLTLRTYEPHATGADWARWAPHVRQAESNIAASLRDSSSIRRWTHHYIAKLDGGDQNHYMYYGVEIVAALALLAAPADQPLAAGRAISAIVRQLARMINSQGGLVLDGRMSVVDQLWADRLLEAFVLRTERTPGQFLPSPVRILFSPRKTVRGLTGLALAVVTGLAAVSATSNEAGLVQAVGFLVSGLGLTALGFILFAKRDP